MVEQSFKYEIGDIIWQYTVNGYETAIVLERKTTVNGNYYITDLIDYWEHEDFLKGDSNS